MRKIMANPSKKIFKEKLMPKYGVASKSKAPSMRAVEAAPKILPKAI